MENTCNNKKMQIVVCIKYMLNNKTGVSPFKINKYDRAALKSGIFLKNKLKSKLTVVTMGPESAEDILRYSLASGADNAVLITDKALIASDTYVTSKVIAKAVKKIGRADIVICGNRSSDGDTGQVGPQIAVNLDMPHLSCVAEICNVKQDELDVKVQTECEYLTYHVKYPIMLCVSRYDRAHLYNLKKLKKALQAPITKFSIADLGLSPENVGQSGSKTEVVHSQGIVYNNECCFIDKNDLSELLQTINKYRI